MNMSARDRQVARETVRDRADCHHCNPGAAPPEQPRPAYRLAYLDPLDERRATLSPTVGPDRDAVLETITRAALYAPMGTPVPAFAVLTDLDVLATDPAALELALRTDPALAAICRTVSKQARADERGRWVEVVSAIDHAKAARAADRQARRIAARDGDTPS